MLVYNMTDQTTLDDTVLSTQETVENNSKVTVSAKMNK